MSPNTTPAVATPAIPTPAVAIVAGHICLDIIPTIIFHPGQDGQLVMPGKLAHVGPATIATGGAVSNTGLALHRLGVVTRLMGKVGKDYFGEIILQIISRRDPQLAAGMVVDAHSPSSYTVVLSAPGLDRSFLHCAGANDTFCAADVDVARLAEATLFHFGYPPIMQRIYADGGWELAGLMQRIKEAGLATSLDTAHVDVDAPAGKVDWRQYLARVLPYVDFFLPSFDEIFFMVDRTGFQALASQTGEQPLVVKGGIQLLRELATTLLGMGVAVVGLKLGDQGIYLRTTPDPARLEQTGRVALSSQWLDRELLAPTFEVEVVGTTGAGDCAVAGFLAALLRGLGPEEALIAAVAAGACNVEVADAISGIPTWEALQARIAGGWPCHTLEIRLDDWRHDTIRGLWFSPLDQDPRRHYAGD